MKKNPEFYFCYQCKKTAHNSKDFIIVDESTLNHFCTEKCLLEFYSPLIFHLKEEEKQLRISLNLTQEPLLDRLSEIHFEELTLPQNEEVWICSNSLQEEICYFILHLSTQEYFHQESPGSSFYYLFACFVFENRPCFILWETLTHDQQILQFYRSGERASLESNRTSQTENSRLTDAHNPPEKSGTGPGPGNNYDQEVFDLIEHKKSSMLTNLLDLRAEEDVPIEDFTAFEPYLQETLENSDEVYQGQDEEGDYIFSYFKTFQNGEKTFFYIVLCMLSPLEKDRDQDILYPILYFPTQDLELYRRYKRGEKISGHLKN